MLHTKYQISLLIADDHEILRDGLRAMFKKHANIDIVGEAVNGEELVSMASSLQPDIIIADIKMPKMDGVEATKLITVKFPQVKVIAFTMFEEEALIVDMLEAGAHGYLLKSSGKEEILEAIDAVMADKSYYCRETTQRLTHLIARSKFDLRKGLLKPIFTEKELTVIKLICEGFINKEIASAMKLSMRTVEGHREKIQEKMKTKNTAGIVVFAIRTGIYKWEKK